VRNYTVEGPGCKSKETEGFLCKNASSRRGTDPIRWITIQRLGSPVGAGGGGLTGMHRLTGPQTDLGRPFRIRWPWRCARVGGDDWQRRAASGGALLTWGWGAPIATGKAPGRRRAPGGLNGGLPGRRRWCTTADSERRRRRKTGKPGRVL
jgi:hypothetical protein